MRRFNLDQYITKGVVYFHVNKRMYDLKQAGLLANKGIVEHLAKDDYIKSKYVPCLFVSKDKSTAFCLIIDDLHIKANKHDRERLYMPAFVSYMRSQQTTPDLNTST